MSIWSRICAVVFFRSSNQAVIQISIQFPNQVFQCKYPLFIFEYKVRVDQEEGVTIKWTEFQGKRGYNSLAR